MKRGLSDACAEVRQVPQPSDDFQLPWTWDEDLRQNCFVDADVSMKLFIEAAAESLLELARSDQFLGCTLPLRVCRLIGCDQRISKAM